MPRDTNTSQPDVQEATAAERLRPPAPNPLVAKMNGIWRAVADAIKASDAKYPKTEYKAAREIVAVANLTFSEICKGCHWSYDQYNFDGGWQAVRASEELQTARWMTFCTLFDLVRVGKAETLQDAADRFQVMLRFGEMSNRQQRRWMVNRVAADLHKFFVDGKF